MFTIRYRLFYATAGLRLAFYRTLPQAIVRRMYAEAQIQESAVRGHGCDADHYDMVADRAVMLWRAARA